VVEGKVLTENIGALHGVYHTNTSPRSPAIQGAQWTVSRDQCMFVLI